MVVPIARWALNLVDYRRGSEPATQDTVSVPIHDGHTIELHVSPFLNLLSCFSRAWHYQEQLFTLGPVGLMIVLVTRMVAK